MRRRSCLRLGGQRSRRGSQGVTTVISLFRWNSVIDPKKGNRPMPHDLSERKYCLYCGLSEHHILCSSSPCSGKLHSFIQESPGWWCKLCGLDRDQHLPSQVHESN